MLTMIFWFEKKKIDAKVHTGSLRKCELFIRHDMKKENNWLELSYRKLQRNENQNLIFFDREQYAPTNSTQSLNGPSNEASENETLSEFFSQWSGIQQRKQKSYVSVECHFVRNQYVRTILRVRVV